MSLDLTKKCTKCFKMKPLDEFYNQKSANCKDCLKDSGKEWRSKNSEKILKRVKDWTLNKKQENPKWKVNISRKYDNKRYKTNEVYREIRKLRSSIRRVFTGKVTIESSFKWENIIGIDKQGLVNHLHSTFEYIYGLPRECINLADVEIDHITPLSTAQSVEDVHRLNHYTNLQLLFKEDNQDKGKVMNRIADAN